MPAYSWGLRVYGLSDPTVLTTWERTGDVASSTLTLPSTPAVGGTVFVTVSLWSSDVTGLPSQGINPTTAMLASNNGGSFARDVITLCTDGRDVIDRDDTPGVAIFRHRVESIASLPYTVTLDIEPGGSGSGYWTWSLIYVSDVVESSPLIATATAYLPHESNPGLVPTHITCGSAPHSTNRGIAIAAFHNGGHEADGDIADPPGYIAVAHNEENSAFLAGHSSYKLLTGASTEAPTMALTNFGAPTFTYCRGCVAIYRRVGGV